jgi:Flp pilus assembly pilin Flp
MNRRLLKPRNGILHSQVLPRPGASERGQGLIEYALIMILASLVATVTLVLLGPAVKNVYCSIIEVFDPWAIGECIEVFEVTILNTQYNPDTQELRLMAKAPKDCEEDLIIQGYGTMERVGSSYVFKKTMLLGSQPSEVTIGDDACGWATEPID